MAPKHAEELGVKDLSRAKSLDVEAYMYWSERGQLFHQAKNEFFCLLRRARGMLTLIKDANFRDAWGIEGLIAQAEDMLQNPEYSQSNLFEGVNLVSRRQQLNDLRIQYALSKNDTVGAATLAMKILVEDEYVIDTVLMNCVTTLNTHFGLHGEAEEVPHIAQGVKRETRRGQVDSMREAKNVILAVRLSCFRDNLLSRIWRLTILFFFSFSVGLQWKHGRRKNPTVRTPLHYATSDLLDRRPPSLTLPVP